MIPMETIHRPSLHEELVDRLRNLVIEDALKPGEKVPEKDLCNAFGVSRTPLREALKVLASEGLIVLQANRGARVAEITDAELAQAFPVIAALEQLAAELACTHIDTATIANIERLHEDMRSAFEQRDRPAYFKANQSIHTAIIRAAGNDILETQHRLVASRVRRARFVVNLSDDRWSEAIQEHQRMIALLKDRNGAELGKLMKSHLLNKHNALSKSP